MRFSALDASSAWASVLATMNSAPVSPAAIMLLMAFPPAPPTPMTAMRGLMFLRPSKALAEPLSHTPQITLSLRPTPTPEHSRAGIECDLHETGRRGERRAGKRPQQGVHRLQARYAYGPRKVIGRQLAQSSLLARSAGQDDTLGIARRLRALEAAGNLAEQTQHPVADDGADLSLGRPRRTLRRIVDKGVGDGLGVIRSACQRHMIFFDSFSFVNGSRQRLGQVKSCMVAADRHHLAAQKMSLREGRERSCARPHVETEHAPLTFLARGGGE